jgi:hypothetical protein
MALWNYQLQLVCQDSEYIQLPSRSAVLFTCRSVNIYVCAVGNDKLHHNRYVASTDHILTYLR